MVMGRPGCRLLLTIVCCLPGGCAAPRASEGGFDSPDPASKLYAIHGAGEKQEATAVPRLVEQLDNDDPVVRMMAVQALLRITGTRLEYNPYAPIEQRREAIRRWTEAVRTGRLGRHEPWETDESK